MALDMTYTNRLKQLLSDPSSFSMSPDAQVGMNSGLDALTRSNSAMRGSGNAMQALVKYGNDSAQADYGKQIDRLTGLQGQAQTYDLGQGANANTATRNANDFTLGTQANDNTRYATDQSTGLGYFKGAADFILGQGQNANTATRNANDLTLGTQSNANTAQGNAYNYDLGKGRNANDAASTFANYDLGQGRNAVDWYNAGTNRGNAQSNAYVGDQASQRAWYNIFPRQKIAGQP